MTKIKSELTNPLIIFLIVISTLLVYWQIYHHDFINFDDDSHVTMNSSVRAGLTWEGFTETFSVKNQYTYWHPLTWLSHMLDCELFGLNPGMHHLVSLIFHIANSVILFIVLRRMTGMIWQSAFVAFVFSLHPINVESVSWVAARKTVLSTFFWMLAMLVYSYYVERPKISKYLLLVLMFILGLLAKPLLIALPFVFLLLDYWPLRRIRLGKDIEQAVSKGMRPGETRFSFLVLEKVPFLLIAILSVIVSIMSQRGAIVSYVSVPMDLRIANALVSYVKYIGKMLWPVNLAVFYPFPISGIASWQVVAAAIILILITVAVLAEVKKRPYLAVGWFWFAGTLIPVSGLIQNGNWPALADRWAYVPFIGLFVMTAWGLSDIVSNWRSKRNVIPVSALCVCTLLAVMSFNQIKYWKNSISLFTHTIDVTKNNKLAYNNLGASYGDSGNIDLAIHNLSEAITIDPGYVKAHFNIGVVFQKAGLFDEAMVHYLNVLRLDPNHFNTYSNVGIILYSKGYVDDAIAQFNKALEISPENTSIRNNLGIAYLKKGTISNAKAQFEKVIQINPGDKLAQKNLQSILILQAKPNNHN